MANMTLTVVDSTDKMTEKVINAFRLHLNSVFKRAASSIQRRLGEVCESLITRSEEYNSLLSGQLLGELGVPEIRTKLDRILTTIKNSVTVEWTPIIRQGSELSGGLVFKMIRSDFLDIIGLPESYYLTEKGTTIPWLEWLIMEGDRIIIIGYDVKLNLTPKERSSSRTGLALMTHGSGWRVPPQWSGTVQDNFITRAFVHSEFERLLLEIVRQEIIGRL